MCKAAVFVSNTPRYNAKVVEVVDKETYRLQYTDYGNEEVVNIKRIVTSLETLVVQMVDVGVNLQLQLFYKHNFMHSFRHCPFFSIRVNLSFCVPSSIFA